MPLDLDLGVIVQGAILGAIVWHGRTVSQLLKTVTLHEWRLRKLEE